MKYRSGFVSNSSSTSFMVALNMQDKCHYCGRTSLNIIDAIENGTCNDGDTKVHWKDPTEYINELNQQIVEYQKELEQYVGLQDNEDYTIRYHTGYSYTYKVGKLRSMANEQIRLNRDVLEQIKEKLYSGKQVVSFSISYHESVLNELVNDAITRGELEVIREDS